MPQANNSSPVVRYNWVDIAKGVGIILVVIGHTVKYGSPVRNFFFSSHMPLFFILSGFTGKVPELNSAVFVKYVRRLLLPCLLFFIIEVGWQLAKMPERSAAQLWNVLRVYGERFWWGSGVKVGSHPALGMLWFMISLFWAKIALSAAVKYFKNENLPYFGFACGTLALLMAQKHLWLPQNFDVTLIAILFIVIGVLWRQHVDVLKKYELPLFFCAWAFWWRCLSGKIYIEIAARHYPGSAQAIIEAIAATFVLCRLCRVLEDIRFFQNIFVYIGKNTLVVYLVHALDYNWAFAWQSQSHFKASLLRLAVDLAIAAVYCLTRDCLKCRRKAI